MNTTGTMYAVSIVFKPRPQRRVLIYRFGGKPGMQTRMMAGTAPHKRRRCRDKSRSDNHTQTILDLRDLPQTNTW